tara:strand:+ start:1500 stop:1907 length:408 start_codon:yes stop_codon:yes gene_type:complete
MAKNRVLTLNADKLKQLVAEELRKMNINEHRGEPGDPSDPPQRFSQSRVRRDNKDYESDTMRKDRTFPAYADLKRLSYGVVSEAFDEMMTITEGSSGRHCFSSEELKKYKDKIFHNFLRGISAYKDAEKGKYGEV